jgi:hypothetical protein
MDRACSTHRKEKECIQVSVVKPEGKRTSRRPRRMRRNNIIINFRQVGICGVD